MNVRRATSLTALISFLVLMLNSIILYIVPEGRVAYWADWHLWGLTKPQWGAQHVVIGFLFFVTMVLHIYYNWNAIVAYLKGKAKKVRMSTREFIAAVAITALCVVGAYFPIPPFNWILDLSAHFKDAAEVTYGAPPYGHAELSTVKSLAKRTDLDLAESLARLREAGMLFESEDQTLQEIAETNGVSPSAVFLAMSPPVEQGRPKPMPVEPVSGTGKKTIQDICETYGLDLTAVLQVLAERDVQATADMNLKEVGSANRMAPDEIYALIREGMGIEAPTQ